MNTIEFGSLLSAARHRQGLTQRQLAKATRIHQSAIADLESSKRVPSLALLLRIAGALKVPIQWFLTGSEYVGGEIADIAIQLQHLGIVDLHVTNERVPGAFRRDEEVIAISVSGNSPSARIIEAIPAVLAWNKWNPTLLRAHARVQGGFTAHRIGWLADIAITIHRNQGFPGGCPSLRRLESYVRRVQPPEGIDHLGFSPEPIALPPVSFRWKMHYPADLKVFRERAEHLHTLWQAKKHRISKIPRPLE
jgi:transcriptional regulator with XRE-family HTH domain